ncbi:hypothetical protein V6N12_029628 [Hibiscus sabdariffa]|uniref:Uncharacterized protein n=1 Tax=Hibiscus sabdariffa TaxID=183260 RepID=A0ABR2CXH1_9ROSI
MYSALPYALSQCNLIGPLPHRSIHALSLKYGSIMHLKFGSFPVVVTSSLEMAKAVLKTNDVIFTDRPRNAAGKYTTYNYSDITWSPYGPYWRQARKICMTELFSAKRLESYDHIRREEMNLFVKRLYESCGTTLVWKDRLLSLSLNIISRVVLGKKYTEGTGENEIASPKQFNEMIGELFLLNGVLDICDSIPWLSFLDLQGNIKRMKALSKKFDRFLEHVLDEHNERRKGVQGYVAKDMLDVLLQLSENPNLDVKLERHGVKAFCQVFVICLSFSRIVSFHFPVASRSSH